MCKRLTVAVLLTLIVCLPLTAQKWQGRQGSTRIMVELCGGEGSPVLQITSPELYLNAEKANLIEYDGRAIVAAAQNGSLTMEGTFESSGDTLQSIFKLYNKEYKMNMVRVDSLIAHDFPQHPVPPFPYKAENVRFQSEPGVTLAGTLTIPEGEGPFPAVIMVSGTGKHDRNATYAGHRFFEVIADYFTRRGMVLLRHDDRGVGESTGDWDVATSSDFRRDAEAGILYLRNRPEVDTQRIGVMGHSEGGMIAMMLAADSPGVAFAVSLAGVGVDGLEILKLQNDAMLRTMPDMDESRVAAFMEMYTMMFETVKATPRDKSLEETLTPVFEDWVSSQDDARMKLLNLEHGRDKSLLARYLYDASRPWYREMIDYDPADYLPRVKVPILALNGGMDINVPAKENLANIDRLLRQSPATQWQVTEIAGLNHMFQRCVKCDIREIAELDEVIYPEALETILQWLLSIGILPENP